MRKSIEHLGPQHEVLDIMVADNLVMRVCPDFEIRRFKFMHGVLSSHGSLFQASAFPAQYPKFSLGGRCYDQAMNVSLSHGLTYCEGALLTYPSGKLLPMPHAWCCDSSGRIIDPTCHSIQHRDDLYYWGIKFKTAYAVEWHRRYGFHGLLDGHPELGDTVGIYADPVEDWKA